MSRRHAAVTADDLQTVEITLRRLDGSWRHRRLVRRSAVSAERDIRWTVGRKMRRSRRQEWPIRRRRLGIPELVSWNAKTRAAQPNQHHRNAGPCDRCRRHDGSATVGDWSKERIASEGEPPAPQQLGSGRRNNPPPSLADDACQEPKVCGLPAGGNWIRNFSSAQRRRSRASRRCAMQSTRFGRTTVKRWVGDLETRGRNVIRT